MIPAAVLNRGLSGLQASLIEAGDGAADPAAVRAAVLRAWAGGLATPDAEFDLATGLGELLLPLELRECLAEATNDPPSTEPLECVVIATGPSLARVPWELLVVDRARGLRLLETARVRGGLSAAVGVGARAPSSVSGGGHALRVLDPGPSVEQGRQRSSLYRGGCPLPLYEEGLDERWFARDAPGDAVLNELDSSRPVTREELSECLRDNTFSRLFFFGHTISGTPLAPSAAGLVLADLVDGGRYRPFTAADWIRAPQRWPSPPRMAVISCHSNDTHLHEQMGLVQAGIHAGAALVTSTRWTLPTDGSVPAQAGATPTTDLALAVDDAHGDRDPIGALRRWQLTRLDDWRREPTPANAPLIWASPVSYQRSPLAVPAMA